MKSDQDKALHYRKLENMYHSASVNRTIPSCMTIYDRYVEIHMQISQDFWHSAHAMHGSMYFKGLDDAAFFAANAWVEAYFVVTAKFEVELLGMVTSSDVRAVGFFEKQEGRKLWARSELYNDQNQLVAKGSGLFVASQIALSPEVGYA